MHLFDRPQPAARGLGSLNITRRQALAAGLLAASAPLLAGCFGSGGGSGTVYGQPSGDVPARFKDRQRVVLWSNWTAHNAAILQKNIDAFHTTYKTTETDGMWLSPEDRVRIW